jgi:hypothetical protein
MAGELVANPATGDDDAGMPMHTGVLKRRAKLVSMRNADGDIAGSAACAYGEPIQATAILWLSYVACPYVYPGLMAERNRRINVTLEPDYAQKLASLAERTHVQEGTLARSLLSSALDEADPDASRITEILDGIPGAWERAQDSIEQARRGETVSLSEL